MSSYFKCCFPTDDGMMVCQHPNGSWIVFPRSGDYGPGNESTPPDTSESELDEDEDEIDTEV